jgi:hypothetical protein
VKLENIQKVLNKIIGTAKKKNPISFLLSFLFLKIANQAAGLTNIF